VTLDPARVGGRMLPVPMLARSGPLPTRSGCAFEPKWDGFRAIMRSGETTRGEPSWACDWCHTKAGREAASPSTGRDVDAPPSDEGTPAGQSGEATEA
jgi:hypothetical protein